jgi:arginase family enzyme
VRLGKPEPDRITGGSRPASTILHCRPGARIDMPATELSVLGVPTSAGAHHAGQDLAPAALREHGFVDALQAAGSG